VAITFLGWLHQRGQTLAGCTQHDIDAWYASGTGCPATLGMRM
jgi:hypothetical protein